MSFLNFFFLDFNRMFRGLNDHENHIIHRTDIFSDMIYFIERGAKISLKISLHKYT